MLYSFPVLIIDVVLNPLVGGFFSISMGIWLGRHGVTLMFQRLSNRAGDFATSVFKVRIIDGRRWIGRLDSPERSVLATKVAQNTPDRPTVLPQIGNVFAGSLPFLTGQFKGNLLTGTTSTVPSKVSSALWVIQNNPLSASSGTIE